MLSKIMPKGLFWPKEKDVKKNIQQTSNFN
jgi:hypothetical protein